MAAVTGLTITKRFTYRGQPEEFSNTYHFKSPPPGNTASWDVLLDDVQTIESTIYPPAVEWISAYGYDSDDPNAHHVYQKDWTQGGGQLPVGGFPPPPNGHLMAGDQAALQTWWTDALSTRGKPIILHKYLHHGYVSSTDPDMLQAPEYLTQIRQAAGQLQGIYGGLRSRSRDLNVVASGASDTVTTRTLKHRGKKGGPR